MSKWSNILVASRSAGIPTAPVASPVPPELMTGATWVGRGDDRFDSSGVQYWNNRVSGGTDLITQPSASFRPTAITDALGGTPGTVDGAHFGSGASLDGWEATNVSSLIGLSTWHIFALVKFDSSDYEAGLSGFSNIFASTNSTTLSSWGTSFLLAVNKSSLSSPTYVTGYALVGGVNHSLYVPITLGAPALIEWWGDGSVMYLRVNGDKPVTKAYAGNISQHATLAAKVGSVNYEGGWDDSNNRLYELAIANTKNDDVAGVRTYFAERYNVEVLPVVDTTAEDFLPDTLFDNWWHGESLVTGSPVTSWEDRIGGLVFEAPDEVSRPTITFPAGYDGKPAISLDGLTQVLQGLAGVDILGFRPWSAWLIGGQNAGGAGSGTVINSIWQNSYEGGAYTRNTHNGSFAIRTDLSVGVGYVGVSTAISSYYTWLLTNAADGTLTCYRNGVLFWANFMATATSGTVERFRLGGVGADPATGRSNFSYFDWAVKRGVVLTALDAVALHAYAQAKYGIA